MEALHFGPTAGAATPAAVAADEAADDVEGALSAPGTLQLLCRTTLECAAPGGASAKPCTGLFGNSSSASKESTPNIKRNRRWFSSAS